MPAATKPRLSGNNRRAKAPKAPEKPRERITIPKPKIREFSVTLKGTTALVLHRFSEKAKKAIEDKQQQKGRTARGKRDPKAEYLAACYVFPGHQAGKRGCHYGIPAVMIKAALVDACRFVEGVPMTFARGAVHILDEEAGLVTLKFRKMQMIEDPVRIGKGTLDLRYRPEFSDWSVKVRIRYNADAISAEQIVNLLSTAGFSCGLGEKRPNSNSGPGGSNGMFEVAA